MTSTSRLSVPRGSTAEPLRSHHNQSPPTDQAKKTRPVLAGGQSKETALSSLHIVVAASLTLGNSSHISRLRPSQYGYVLLLLFASCPQTAGRGRGAARIRRRFRVRVPGEPGEAGGRDEAELEGVGEEWEDGGGQRLPLGERGLGLNLDGVAITLDGDAAAEVAGLALDLDLLLEELFEVSNVENLVVRRNGAVQRELLDLDLLGGLCGSGGVGRRSCGRAGGRGEPERSGTGRARDARAERAGGCGDRGGGGCMGPVRARGGAHLGRHVWFDMRFREGGSGWRVGEHGRGRANGSGERGGCKGAREQESNVVRHRTPHPPP